ncbi:flavin reductase family protein [Microlunatus sp. GCM10028923]|uniref:flavin reductase family protein n=1 Tax=Microlunatus sp. GCM10028923 TaxID=3273400 RepID=UPI00360F5FD2
MIMSPDPTDQRAYRSALGRYASGLTVITCRTGDRLDGMTCQSFTSVSLEPPLVSVCLRTGTATLAAIEEAGSFCVNVLAGDQQPLADRFGRPRPDRWLGLTWTPSTAGHPELPGCLLWLDCTLSGRTAAGDHTLVVGRVERIRLGDPAAGPLLYYGGDYRGLGDPSAEVRLAG